MPSTKILKKKNEQIVIIQKRLLAVKSFIILNFNNIKNNELQKFRSDLKDHDIEIKIIKNSIFKHAILNQNKYKNIINILSNNNIFIFSYNNGLLPFNLINKYIKKNENIKFKAGYFENTFIDENSCKSLAKYENKSELLSYLFTCIKYPLIKLSHTLFAITNTKK